MTIARDYVPAKRHVKLTPGRSLQIVRELQELTQSELARRTGISQSAISAFESGSQEIGLKRVKVLADALGVHPAVIAFPDYEAPPRPRSGTDPSTRRPAGPVARTAFKVAAKRRAG
jgi:transcriptional regulator with XRE-family HTH domain